MTTAKQRTEGFSSVRAHATAMAAVHAAGGTVSPHVHSYARKVSAGEMSGDAAVREVIARSVANLKRR